MSWCSGEGAGVQATLPVDAAAVDELLLVVAKTDPPPTEENGDSGGVG